MADPGAKRPFGMPSPVLLGSAIAPALAALLICLRILDLHPHVELSPIEMAALLGQLALIYGIPAFVLGGLADGVLSRLRVEKLGGAVAGLFLIAPLTWFLWSYTQDTGRFADPADMRADASAPLLEVSTAAQEDIVPRQPSPTPVVLLVVDGADPKLIEQSVEAGSLPTFERLMEGGTWGPLLSQQPTLSPILWTTLATGRPEAAHGVHDFTRFKVPGVATPLDVLPPGTGLQYWIFPWLERLPRSPWVRVPVTSDVRRAATLWDVAGRHWPVGVYRWLVTWPAEPTSGFLVAGGVWAGASEDGGWHPDSRRWREAREEHGDGLDHGWFEPAELAEQLPPPRPAPRGPELRPYLRPGDPIDHQDPDLRFIARSLREPTLRHLGWLVEHHRPTLLAASFYSVDAFGHRFVDQHRDGGPYERAITARYQMTDRQLGRLIERLDTVYGSYHLLVVSDHGWDFEAGHHFDAPAGFFLAHGPAFEADRWVPGASLFDVAPLVLHLLGLPVAESMPGAHLFETLLAPDALPPPRWIADYPRPPRETQQAPALDERRRQELRSLGYLP